MLRLHNELWTRFDSDKSHKLLFVLSGLIFFMTPLPPFLSNCHFLFFPLPLTIPFPTFPSRFPMSSPTSPISFLSSSTHQIFPVFFPISFFSPSVLSIPTIFLVVSFPFVFSMYFLPYHLGSLHASPSSFHIAPPLFFFFVSASFFFFFTVTLCYSPSFPFPWSFFHTLAASSFIYPVSFHLFPFLPLPLLDLTFPLKYPLFLS